jgi:NAD(P) transhydrogenase subunit alpha
VIENGVTIIGTTNLQGKVAVDASQMYSRNMEKLVFHMMGDGALKIDLNEEITKGCVITHAGEIVNSRVAEVATAKGAA